MGYVPHYKQVLWRASTRIGCAIVDCPNIKYSHTVLCDYVTGSDSGQRPY
jgi:hypothetical protein